MFSGKEKPLSREDAKQLYQDLQKSVEILKTRKGKGNGVPSGGVSDATARAIAQEISAAMKKDSPGAGRGRTPLMPSSSRGIETIDQRRERRRDSFNEKPNIAMKWPNQEKNRGPIAAISFVAAIAVVKMAMSFLEYSGVFTVQIADASYQMQNAVHQGMQQQSGQPYSPQELQILTSLDSRRVELDSRRQQLDEREKEIEKRDREFATRMTELRELSSKLKIDREKTEKKQDAQLAQLANVYNSMNPNEAAQLLDQLDEVTALSLLEKMSEKRIGQILPLMKPERALTMTRMFSGRH